jgi:hypothetical protein
LAVRNIRKKARDADDRLRCQEGRIIVFETGPRAARVYEKKTTFGILGHRSANPSSKHKAAALDLMLVAMEDAYGSLYDLGLLHDGVNGVLYGVYGKKGGGDFLRTEDGIPFLEWAFGGTGTMSNATNSDVGA